MVGPEYDAVGLAMTFHCKLRCSIRGKPRGKTRGMTHSKTHHTTPCKPRDQTRGKCSRNTRNNTRGESSRKIRGNSRGKTRTSHDLVLLIGTLTPQWAHPI